MEGAACAACGGKRNAAAAAGAGADGVNIAADATPAVEARGAEAVPAGCDALGKAPNKLEVVLNAEASPVAVSVPRVAASQPAEEMADA